MIKANGNMPHGVFYLNFFYFFPSTRSFWKLVTCHFCRDAWFSFAGPCGLALHSIMYNEYVRAVTESLTSSVRQSSSWRGRLGFWRQPDLLLAEKKRTVHQFSIWMKWSCAYIGEKKCLFPQPHHCHFSWRRNTDEISGQMSRQGQTAGHHLQRLNEKDAESGGLMGEFEKLAFYIFYFICHRLIERGFF